MTCFLCEQEIIPEIHGEAWEFAEGIAHQDCAISSQTTAAAEDFLDALRESDEKKWLFQP